MAGYSYPNRGEWVEPEPEAEPEPHRCSQCKTPWGRSTIPCPNNRAVAIFEQRMGFGYTEEYAQSREWSGAIAEASAEEDS